MYHNHGIGVQADGLAEKNRYVRECARERGIKNDLLAENTLPKVDKQYVYADPKGEARRLTVRLTRPVRVVLFFIT